MKWHKFMIGLGLLPLLAAVALSAWELLNLGWRGEAWRAPWFWALIGGLIVWTGAYLVLPRPMWIYVFGHELTHALGVYLCGGKIVGFRVATYGGHVKTDTINWWITLAPYFVPLYALLWVALWFTVDFYLPLDDWMWVLFAGLGVTYGFHVTFTISMIAVGQSDITSQGTLFSLVIVLLFNLLLIQLFLVAVLDGVTYAGWFSLLWQHTAFLYQAVGSGIVAGALWAWHHGQAVVRGWIGA